MCRAVRGWSLLGRREEGMSFVARGTSMVTIGVIAGVRGGKLRRYSEWRRRVQWNLERGRQAAATSERTFQIC